MAMQFDDTQAAALLDALGLPADTAAVDLVVQTAADLAAQVAGMNPAQPSSVAAAAKRHGMEVIDTATADAMRADAAAGRQIAAAAAKARVEAAVEDAINRGKITPSRRSHWVSLIEADPGMADVLAAVPNETAVPLTEVGHSVEAELASPPARGTSLVIRQPVLYLLTDQLVILTSDTLVCNDPFRGQRVRLGKYRTRTRTARKPR